LFIFIIESFTLSMASDKVNDEVTLKFRHPNLLIIHGKSMSGKSVLVREMLDKREKILDKPLDKIIYVYTEYQVEFDEMKKNIPNIEFTKDITCIDNMLGKQSLLILDDKLLDFETKDNRFISEYFIKKSHHKNVSVWALFQNLYGKNMRLCSLNQTYLITFDSPRDQSVFVTLNKQVATGHPKFLLSVAERVFSEPFKYIVFDFSPQANRKFRIRNTIDFQSHTEFYRPSI